MSRDLIERQKAIDAECEVCQIAPKKERGHNCIYYVHGCKEIECLRVLPSAQPASQWIPVSEGLPEKSGLYLAWFKYPYEEEPTWSIINYDADCEAFGEWRERYHPETLGYLDSEFEELEDVTAWMPLPEPYRAERRTDA